MAHAQTACSSSLHNHWTFRDVLYSCHRAVPLPETPELRLVAGVLESGLRAACGCEAGIKPRSRERRRAEALAWIMSDEAEYLLSFRSCCEMLQLNSQSVRQAVQNGALHRMYKESRGFSD